MKIAKVIALLGWLAMTGVLIYGFTAGGFAEEGKQLLSMPWGIVSLVDLYVGFAGLGLDRLPREISSPVGRLGGADDGLGLLDSQPLYIHCPASQWGRDWQRFWMGHRAVEY